MALLRSFITVYTSAFAGIPREVWLLSGALLVNRAGTMVLPFLSLYLTADIGLTAVRAGQIIGCFGLGSMLGSYAGGWLSDRFSPLRIQQHSLLVSGCGFLLFIRLDSFVELAAGIFILAAVSDAFRPALMVSVAHFSPAGVNKRAFALIRLAANVGMATGPAIAGLLAHYGYAWLFVGDAITCWLAALMLWLTLGATDGPHQTRSDAGGHAGTSPWRDGPYLFFLLLIVILGMAFFQVWTTMPLYLRSFYGASERAIGILLSINALVIVLAEMLVIRAVERFDAMRTIAAGAFLVGAGLSLLPFGPPYLVAVLAIVVLTFGEMLALPITNAIVADRAGRAQMGQYMGLFTLAFSTAFVIGPIVGTAVYQHLGPETLWYGLGCTGIGLAIGFVVLRRFLQIPSQGSSP